MVKKKVVKKKAPKKKVTRKKPAVKSKAVVKEKRLMATPSKFRLVTRNLIMFIILAAISFVLSVASSNALYVDFFTLLAWILTFIALAFFISLLILMFLKALRK